MSLQRSESRNLSQSVSPEWKYFVRVRSFWFGLTLPAKALKLLLSTPKLILLSIIPIALTLSLYIYAFALVDESIRSWLNQLLASWGASPDSAWIWVTHILLKLVLVVVGGITFAFSAGLIATPFNDFIAEHTEIVAEPKLTLVQGLTLRDQIQHTIKDFLKTLMAASLSLIALLLSLLPALNIVTLGITFLLMAFQFLTFPQTRRGMGVKESFQFLGRHFFACLGFGMSITFLFSIPFLAAFALPVAVVGGTLLFARSNPSSEQPKLR